MQRDLEFQIMVSANSGKEGDIMKENVRRLVRLDKRYEESCTSQVPSRDPQMAAAYQVDVLFSLVW